MEIKLSAHVNFLISVLIIIFVAIIIIIIVVIVPFRCPKSWDFALCCQMLLGIKDILDDIQKVPSLFGPQALQKDKDEGRYSTDCLTLNLDREYTRGYPILLKLLAQIQATVGPAQAGSSPWQYVAEEYWTAGRNI